MSKKIKQKFRSEWLKDTLFKEWLITKKDSNNELIGFCKLCSCPLASNKYGDLKTHLKSKKHIAAYSTLAPSRQPVITQVLPNQTLLLNTKSAEGKAALFIAEHCSVLTMDHLGNLMKSMFPDSEIAKNLSMHRSKCSEVLKNVLGPHFKEELRKDIGESPFSLLIDESTDVGVMKFLGIVIVYHSKNTNTIISTFLTLAQLVECNAEAIVTAIKTTLTDFKLQLGNLKGIGTDNASVMVGVNNGVYARLKNEVPNLILVRCICHSIQLSVSAASVDTIPRCVEFLIAETYNWFSRSTLRQSNYHILYATINNGHTPLKIVQSCQTRWLSIESAVSRILDQWVELKTHFQLASSNENCYIAQTLYEMFNDDINYAWLAFLRPVLVETQRLNKIFESNTADQTKLLSDLVQFLMGLIRKIVLPTTKIDVIETHIESHLDPKPYLGFEFEKTVDKLLETKRLDIESERNVRKRCVSFIVKLIAQLRQRLPENLETLKNIELLAVQNARSGIKNSLTTLLEKMNVPAKTITLIESQWTSISLVAWKSTTTKEFWLEVSNYRDSVNENPFKEISEFAMSMLVLPHSNADVERIFSAMNIVKNKLRNKMKPQMMNAILTIRSGLIRNHKTCHNYPIPIDVIKKIGTSESYNRTASTASTSSTSHEEEGDLSEEEEEFLL